MQNNIIHSFDIFDTCLIRTCGAQDFVFELLAESVLNETSCRAKINDFIKVRRCGEENARNALIKEGKEDITLDEIYSFCNFNDLSDCPKEKIKSLELQCHSKVLIPVWEIRNEIDSLHNNQESVIFISDMYLPTHFLIEELSSTGFYKEGDEIYVSGDIGKTKLSGNLYNFIRNKKALLNTREWIHKGDNKISDYLIPRKIGIKARLITMPFSYYERSMVKNELSSNELDVYKLASISRAIRLSSPNTSHSYFAADFIAPIYVPFVYYILQDAKRRNIKRLYFVARDGLILYKIAEMFKNDFPMIDLHYLYASRKAIYLPGIADITLENLLQIVPLKNNVNVNDILAILHMPDYPIERKSFNNLGPCEIIKRLLDDKNFVNCLRNIYEEQCNLCIQYFIEQSLVKKGSAIVDVFGTRKCQKFISDILRRNGYPEVFGYYYNVLNERIIDKVEYESLNYQERFRFSINDTYYNQKQTIFEQYFSIADHGRTGGYKLERGKVVPIIDSDLIYTYYKKDIFNTNVKICRDFAKHYSILLPNNHALCSRCAQSVFNLFFHIPHKNYLLALEGFCMTEDGVSEPLIYKKNLIRILLNKNRTGSWFHGNLVYNSGIFYKLMIWILSLKWKLQIKNMIKI